MINWILYHFNFEFHTTFIQNVNKRQVVNNPAVTMKKHHAGPTAVRL
jgi:hypothetical protein